MSAVPIPATVARVCRQNNLLIWNCNYDRGLKLSLLAASAADAQRQANEIGARLKPPQVVTKIFIPETTPKF
jgi:hypothetical protein